MGRERARSSDRPASSWPTTASSPQAGQASRDNDGDARRRSPARRRRSRPTYEFPYLAHAAMEPMNCVVKLDGRRLRDLERRAVPDRRPGRGRADARPQARAGEAQHAVRRRQLRPARQSALRLSRRGGGDRQGDRRRTARRSSWCGRARTTCAAATTGPMYCHALERRPRCARQARRLAARIVGQSILAGTPFEAMMVKDGIDATSVEGAANLPYAIPNLAVELHSPTLGVPVLWWRSVGITHTASRPKPSSTSLPRAAGKDPLAFRRALLAQQSAPSGGARARRREGRLGQAARRARRRSAAAASPCTSRSTPSSRRSPK